MLWKVGVGAYEVDSGKKVCPKAGLREEAPFVTLWLYPNSIHSMDLGTSCLGIESTSHGGIEQALRAQVP